MHAPRLLPAVLLLLNGSVRSDEPSRVDAQVQALVRLLRVEPIVEGTVRYNFLHNPRMQSLPESVRTCAANADLSFFNDIYAGVVKETLTPAEIAAAVRYFRSHAGYIGIMLSIRQGRANLDAPELLREVDAAGEPSAEELRKIGEYVRSPLAGKFRQIDLKARGELLPSIGTPKLMAQCAPKS